jgi:hypothetical protein
MGTVTKGITKSKVMKFSIFPKKLLYRVVLGKIKNLSKFFIQEKDYQNVRLVGNLTPIVFIVSTIAVYLVTQFNILLGLLIGTISSVGFLIVFGDHIRSKILNKQQKFEETAFLIINSLSINMLSTESLPYSIELLLSRSGIDENYKKYFTEMIHRLNLGENEDETIQKGSKIFQTKKYENAFQNIKSENAFIDSDPDFLLRVRRGIKLIEDNIIIFIAVSCLLPLVLSIVLSFILPSDSLTIFIFPLLYAIFGTLILRFMQNRETGD